MRDGAVFVGQEPFYRGSFRFYENGLIFITPSNSETCLRGLICVLAATYFVFGARDMFQLFKAGNLQVQRRPQIRC